MALIIFLGRFCLTSVNEIQSNKREILPAAIDTSLKEHSAHSSLRQIRADGPSENWIRTLMKISKP